MNINLICYETTECKLCNKPLTAYDCYSTICMICSFKNHTKRKIIIWKNLSLEDKLYIYNINKLRKIAKKKNLKGYSKDKKEELIEKILPLITEKDLF